LLRQTASAEMLQYEMMFREVDTVSDVVGLSKSNTSHAESIHVNKEAKETTKITNEPPIIILDTAARREGANDSNAEKQDETSIIQTENITAQRTVLRSEAGSATGDAKNIQNNMSTVPTTHDMNTSEAKGMKDQRVVDIVSIGSLNKQEYFLSE